MHKLCHPALVVSVIFAFVLSACGRETYQTQSKMTESEAFDELSSNFQSGRGAFGKSGSAEGLQQLLEKLVAEGKIKVKSNGQGAIDSKNTDLSGLSQILGLITSGKAKNAFSLANQIIKVEPSLATKSASGSSKLDMILDLLQQALPIISTIAPQFAPMISALVVILPMVVTFINLFKKKTPSASATSVLGLSAVRA